VSQAKQLFFIALLPPENIQKVAHEIKQHFAEVYNSRAALKSPPHVTLQPPFFWELAKLADLTEVLNNFVQSRSPIPIIFEGFGAFRPRVIYINVLKTPELLTIQEELIAELETTLGIIHPPSKNRPFAPHLTVGFKDLNKTAFYKAWQEFKERKLYFEFTVPKLTLLAHNGQCWQIKHEFVLENH
jgi:2'-5' RNA ligase